MSHIEKLIIYFTFYFLLLYGALTKNVICAPLLGVSSMLIAEEVYYAVTNKNDL